MNSISRLLLKISQNGSNASLKLMRSVSSTNHPYIFKKLTSQELAEELTRNIIYNKKGILVFNKPFGISFSQEKPKNNEDFEVSLHTLLPFLKDKLNTKTIIAAKVPEKYASGVAVFCTNEEVYKKLKKALMSMRGKFIPAEIYECIVLGKPAHEYGEYNGGVSLVKNGSQKRAKLVQECAKSHVRHGEVKNLKIEFETLASNELASRIRLSITRTMRNALKLFSATFLISPILGDRVFGRLVKTVLGKPILVDMWSPAAAQESKLSPELLSKLDLASREDVEIPLHLHLLKVNIHNFPSKGQHLEFSAPPPAHFLWTCSKLQLHEEDSINSLDLKIKCN